MLFQDLALWPNLSVLDNVRLALSGGRATRKDTDARARAALELCGIAALASARPGRISGGEQQRAALARALAAEPEFLLLDEPFSGLDLATKDRLLGDVRALAERRAITLVLVTHDPREAATLCERAVLLDGGVARESGPWRELLRAPSSPILRLFAEQLGLPDR